MNTSHLLFFSLGLLQKEMECRGSSVFSFNIAEESFLYIRAYIVIIIIFNISGNAILIWALKKTGQTRTISFQFIIIMSISDLVSSIANSIILIITSISQQNKTICWIRLLCQFLLSTCVAYSFIMVALVALDRYLHMRYLERYPSVVTKKRGYCLAIASFVYASTVHVIYSLPLSYNVPYISQSVYIFSTSPIIFSIFVLYYKAMRAMRTKASQLNRSVIAQTRTLSKAAKRITVCVLVLTLPTITIQSIELVNKHFNFSSLSVLGSAKIFAYITYSSIAFWSSYIFMLQNRPIRLLLRRLVRYHLSCEATKIGSTDK